ncbi:hypothetical protein R3W88_011314 [Solanum pinnatisectum]|uniref:NmrA-like domain-containing protein n=1 Tax=Solanum pinnatisectum TaxID=50273 RepID=A0AAV9L658_9SOLN|nr:hypothetical protein R3W88_011314 [Solanum pinnatisectum]
MEEKKSRSSMVVCVTGGSGYIASFLVKKLLEKGYKVHATLRNLEDKSKVGLLNSFPNVEENLKLFQVDMYRPEEFEQAIQGGEFVRLLLYILRDLSLSGQSYLVPRRGDGQFPYKNQVEAAVASVKNIVMSCIKSGTVKRLIYTGSVLASSPMKDDGNGFKDLMDETCWTSLNVHFPFSDNFVMYRLMRKQRQHVTDESSTLAKMDLRL